MQKEAAGANQVSLELAATQRRFAGNRFTRLMGMSVVSCTHELTGFPDTLLGLPVNRWPENQWGQLSKTAQFWRGYCA